MDIPADLPPDRVPPQQIRRMFQSIGHPVEKLRRVRIGSLEDEKLKPGAWRFLTEDEVNQFKRESRK